MTGLPFPWSVEQQARREVSSAFRLVDSLTEFVVDERSFSHVLLAAEASLDDAIDRMDTLR